MEKIKGKKNRKVVVVFFFPPSPSPPSAERKSTNPDEISSGAGRWPREPIGCHWSPREWAGPTLGSLRSTKREGGRSFQKKKKGKKIFFLSVSSLVSLSPSSADAQYPISAIFGACLAHTYPPPTHSHKRRRRRKKKESNFFPLPLNNTSAFCHVFSSNPR